ncbi:two-component sensor histidine kinase [Nocardiopsis terrae]|uniref:histidine kinase n=1 Tax=Nocardiopsis terrae TaxID=372655 RepID=A0ABR9HM68_9ACTN|nr:HAMP domain-containing sensor histidine kinase [Nocardiopsis terrae]MBE1460094.1 two-component system sensor histidine kinase MprB [Nocardiopsis terrae]GHC69665.1 two-component sensor histidine kinase [Nocardiopsis terrae]
MNAFRGSVLLHPGGWRLGTRFAVLFALVAAVTIALVGTLAYSTAAALIRADAESEFDAAVQNLSRQLVVSAENNQSAPDSSTFTFLAPGSLDAQVLASDGTWARLLANRHELSSFHPTDADLEVARDEEAGVVDTREQQVHGQKYRVGTVSLGDGRGAIQLLQRLSPIEQMVGRLATQILWVGLFVALCAASVGWLVGHRITGRLVRLTDAAEYVSSTGRLDPVTPDRGGNGDGDGTAGISGRDGEGNGRNGAPEEPGNDEVGRLGSAFNAMLARLARSKDEQRRLVQDAAHELRTPLTSLRTNVQVLGRVDRLSPEGRQRLIDDLQGETRELTDLVNELVGLATGNHEDESPSAVALADVAERVAARSRRRTGREILVDADDSLVWGRPGALERALANPVENSAKFDPDGSTPIEIRVRDGSVEVLDRGPGVDPEEIDHLFERFFRATVARSLPGSGLGLAMVKEIAHAHGGRVSARNRDGGGTVIGLHLPVHHPPRDESAPGPEESPGPP